VNPIPEVLSNSASEGKLGKRQPESRSKWKDYQQVHILHSNTNEKIWCYKMVPCELTGSSMWKSNDDEH
jgi:hypothetical protein